MDSMLEMIFFSLVGFMTLLGGVVVFDKISRMTRKQAPSPLKQAPSPLKQAYVDLARHLPQRFFPSLLIPFLEEQCGGKLPAFALEGSDPNWLVSYADVAAVQRALCQLSALIQADCRAGNLSVDTHYVYQDVIKEAMVRVELELLLNFGNKLYEKEKLDEAAYYYQQILELCIRAPYNVLTDAQLALVRHRKEQQVGISAPVIQSSPQSDGLGLNQSFLSLKEREQTRHL